jgi:broad specificity phosphatase PhoE
MMRLYFARHGESVANRLQEFSNRGTKHGLTERGKNQAAELAERLKDASIARIYSSPLLRATQTAEILAEKLGVPWEATNALREFDVGVLESRSDAASWQVFQGLLEAWFTRHEWESRIEDGESFLDIQERFLPFIQDILAQDWPESCGLAFVGHGGLYICMLPILLENVDHQADFLRNLDNTDMVIAEVQAGGLVCLSWGKTGLV